MSVPEDLAALVEKMAARERLYSAVGKVAANWAAFEHIVNSSLWVLAKVDDQPGACLTAQIPNSGRSFDALASLVTLHGGNKDLIAKINRFAEKTRTLGIRRNRVIHDPWNWDAATSKPYRLEISAQKKLVFGPAPMETDEINQLVDEIFDHIEAFDQLVSEISKQLGTSAGIRFRPSSEEPPPHQPPS